ncbi:hypothetical protein [Paenibacillus popilliae]|uniref:Uncharacterized protein n=1 Tax=Paenibacillus popilliae ATCC 14706 TaxID=1212764 RepID=M9L8G8_PAEPP|nr:hypothetical protein [Paenibacillus popilliae]GAC41482.1 hypothetical protein PPOP_0832 [Paenibacillus popilliae ATCC 14706]
MIPQSAFATPKNIEKIENGILVWDDDHLVEIKKGTKKYDEIMKNVEDAIEEFIPTLSEIKKIDDLLENIEKLLDDM